MSALTRPKAVSEEEYLAMADASDVKLESIDGVVYAMDALREEQKPRDGVVYAMAGAHPDHNTIIQNAGRAFAAAGDARGCRDFNSDQRVKCNELGDYVYPDLTYACGELQLDGISLVNPTLIVEVLSPGTELHDRRDKTPLYRAMPSVEEILLIASDKPAVESYRRHGEFWVYQEARGLEASILVLSYSVGLRDLYRFIEFPPPARRSTPKA